MLRYAFKLATLILMAQCEYSDTCGFFKKTLPAMPDNADELVEKHCKDNSLNCARYMVFASLGTDDVPDDLMPEDKASAYGLIAGA